MNTPLTIIHIDDNPVDRRLIKKRFSKFEFKTQIKLESFSEIPSFLKRIEVTPSPDIILLDIELKNETLTGIHLARECRSKIPKAVIILLSNFHGTDIIQDSLAAGADEYYYKDSISDDFAGRILNSYYSAFYKRGFTALSSLDSLHLKPSRPMPKFVGPTLENIQWSLSQHFQKEIPSSIWITGQKGTGKNLISQIIEAYQPQNIPFIRIHCKKIPPEEFAIRLFGEIESNLEQDNPIEKKGFLEAAHTGWLYLEEISAIPLTIQSGLIKFLENQQFRKIGSNSLQNCSIKFICSTEYDIQELIKKNLFLKELYQHLAQLEITLPPLKNRDHEILELIQFHCRTAESGPYEIDQPAIELLLQHDWHIANIDELFQVLDAMKLQTLNKTLTVLTLPKSFLTLLKSHQSKMSNNPKNSSQKEIPSHFNTATYLEPIMIQRLFKDKMDYQEYCDRLLLELIRILVKENSQEDENFNLFFLEKKLNLARQTIAIKIRKLYNKKLITKRELNLWIRQRNSTKITKSQNII